MLHTWEIQILIARDPMGRPWLFYTIPGGDGFRLSKKCPRKVLVSYGRSRGKWFGLAVASRGTANGFSRNSAGNRGGPRFAEPCILKEFTITFFFQDHFG